MPRGTILPATEKQARPLSQLPTPLPLHSKPSRITARSGLGLRGYKLTAELNLGKFWRICYPGVTISQQQKNRPAPLQTLNPGTSGRCLGERAILQRDRSAIRLRGVAVGRISQLAQIGDASLKVLRDKRLYRSTHKTFEDYCQERFGIGRNYVNRRVVFAGIL